MSTARPLSLLVVAFAFSGLTSCPSETPLCSEQPPSAPGDYTCAVPGYTDRDFDLHLATTPDSSQPLPVILVFHGGGSNKEGAASMTCPDGDLTSSACMNAVAGAQGYAVVYPNGTSNDLAPSSRTWNAGGGVGEWQCVSGTACSDGVDDVAYARALLDELEQVIPIDRGRIYATGLSNGGAMSHRLACELSDRITAIAPVSGANQLVTSDPCVPARAVPVLHMHGTADPCWAYEGGSAACAQTDGLDKISVPATMTGDSTFEGWVTRQGCDATPQQVDLPDTAEDGMTSHEDRYDGCVDGSEVILLTIEGGGHTWPGGYQYNSPDEVGYVTQDFTGSERMVEFFTAHVSGE